VKGDDEQQKIFRELQLRAHGGESSLDNWSLLLTRQPSKLKKIMHLENKAVK
jgi:hypothetical protein